MIPQKFLMMKCIRIVFLIHVIGILFIVYKIYSSVGAQTRLSEVSPNVLTRAAGGNFSGKIGSLDAVFEDNVDDVKETESPYIAADEDTLEDRLEDEDTEEEFNTESVQDNDENAYAEDDINDLTDKENRLDDNSKDEYVDKNIDTSLVEGSKYTKTGGQSLSFKNEQGQSLPVNSATLKNSHWTLTSAGKYSKSIYSPPPNEKAMQRLPQAVVIGSPHSGIRPLLDFMEIHPQIITLKKEIPFFDERKRLQFFSSGFLSQMPLSYSNQVTVGRTHFSDWSKKMVCDFYMRSRSMKVIVILRDPVSRILSQASSNNNGRTGQLVIAQHGQTLKINNDTETVQWGRYVEYLKMWTQCFPKSQIHIVEWSDIMQRPAPTVRKIEGFLRVQYRINENNFRRDETRRVYCIRPFHLRSYVCLSERKSSIPTLSPQEEALIYQFYHKHNEELFQLLGQRYPWGFAGDYSKT